MKKLIFFDLETTGLPPARWDWQTEYEKAPYIVQIAWLITNEVGRTISFKSHIIKPDGYKIPTDTVLIHGISQKEAEVSGLDAKTVFDEFLKDLNSHDWSYVVGHNVRFDAHVLSANLLRLGYDKSEFDDYFVKDRRRDTMLRASKMMNLSKWPKLGELYDKLFRNQPFFDKHDAANDIIATKDCYFEMLKKSEAEK